MTTAFILGALALIAFVLGAIIGWRDEHTVETPEDWGDAR